MLLRKQTMNHHHHHTGEDVDWKIFCVYLFRSTTYCLVFRLWAHEKLLFSKWNYLLTQQQCAYSHDCLTCFHVRALCYECQRAHCLSSTVHTAKYAASMFRSNQLRLEWLTTTVSVRGLSWSILQAVQDLSFAHIAVSDQEELEQVVVAFHRAALAAHRVSHLRPEAAEAEDEWL